MVFEYLKHFKWMRLILSAMATFAVVEALMIEFVFPLIAIEFFDPHLTAIFIFSGTLYVAVLVGETYDPSEPYGTDDLPPSVVGLFAGIILAIVALFMTISFIYMVGVIVLIAEGVLDLISLYAY